MAWALRPQRLGFALAALVGLGLMLYGGHLFGAAHRSLVTQRGPLVAGIVTSVEDDKNPVTYTVQYQVDGRAFTMRSYKAPHRSVEGDLVQLRYDPADPGYAEFAGRSEVSYAEPVILLVVGLGLLGLGGGGILLRRPLL